MTNISLGTLTGLVPFEVYISALTAARSDRLVANATSAPEEMPRDARYFLSATGLTGYGITPEGTLIGLFSLEKRGRVAVEEAIENGVTNLDCFDGFLPAYYSRFGFVETRRVANWTPGAPDVVFMSLVA